MTGLAILGILASVLLTVVVRPPSPKLLNAPNGLQVTAPRVQMRDGRFLAYKAVGVDRENAKHFIITIHGYGASRHLMLPISKVCIAILKTFVSIGFETLLNLGSHEVEFYLPFLVSSRVIRVSILNANESKVNRVFPLGALDECGPNIVQKI
jgi:hypothetical protein